MEKPRTILDDLVMLVSKKGKITATRAARILKVDEDSLLNLARILQEHNIVEVTYSITGDLVIAQGKNLKEKIRKLKKMKEMRKDIKVKVKEEQRATDVDDIIRVMRKRIVEKKLKERE